MKFKISVKADYLLAQLSDRQTAEETQEFLRAVVQENKSSRRSFIILEVRASRPLFNARRPELFDCFKELGAVPSCKIAMLGDTEELCISQDYLALLAQQQGINVRSFPSRAAVFGWLRERRQRQDRRMRRERRLKQERRQPQSRRDLQRRDSMENRQESP